MPPCSPLDEYSLSRSLKAAAVFKSQNHLQTLHSHIIKLGFSRSTVLATGLIDLALKCGHLHDAHKMFDELPHRDVVSWTSMVVGHARHGKYKESVSLFRRMIASGVIPNEYSFSGALTACSGLGALKYGKQIHAQVLKFSVFGSADAVVQNGLLDMYSRCCAVASARRLFDSMLARDAVAWNEMMSGYLCCGQAEEALELLASMVSSGVRPDDFSYAICGAACASLALMQEGAQVHACVVKSGFESDLVVRNALVDMYAKCGCIDSAKLVFDTIPSRDPVLWTAMVSALGKYGSVHDAIATFEKMVELKIRRDEVTYLAILSACGHAGLVSEGWRYFKLMAEEEDAVSLKPEHCGSMVDLLCRNGRLKEAIDFIERIPLKPSVAIWSAFLNSCRLYGNTDLGEMAASRLRGLDPENHSNWVALSTMRAEESEWNETWKIREGMKGEDVKKEPGCSWVEVSNGVHVFLAADRSHPAMGEILQILKALDQDSNPLILG